MGRRDNLRVLRVACRFSLLRKQHTFFFFRNSIQSMQALVSPGANSSPRATGLALIPGAANPLVKGLSKPFYALEKVIICRESNPQWLIGRASGSGLTVFLSSTRGRWWPPRAGDTLSRPFLDMGCPSPPLKVDHR